MDSRIEKHLGRYKSDLRRVGNGEIAAVTPLGLSVEWNEPHQGGQVESFRDDLVGALSFIKEQSQFIMNERYADIPPQLKPGGFCFFLRLYPHLSPSERVSQNHFAKFWCLHHPSGTRAASDTTASLMTQLVSICP